MLIAIFTSSYSYADDFDCRNTGQIPLPLENQKIWIEQTKALSVYAAEHDMKGFCEWNRIDRLATEKTYEYTKSGDRIEHPERIQKYRGDKDTGDRDKTVAELLSYRPKAVMGSWEASMAGHPELKKRTVNWIMQDSCKDHAQQCAGRLADALASTDLKGNYDVPSYRTIGGVWARDSEILAGCMYLDPLNAFGCRSATSDAQDLSRPGITDVGGYKTVAIPLLQDTLADQRITSSLKTVASKLWRRIDSNKFEKSDNIFSELKEELSKNGFEEKAASQEAVKILGAIATGGPNFFKRVDYKAITGFPGSCRGDNSCNLNSIYMAAIAEGLPHADTVKMMSPDPSPYSLPKNSGFPCDIGKSYHFWMSAEISDWLVQKGHSPASAKEASYMAHIGYQLLGGVGGRENDMVSLPRFGAVENGIRMDMNLAAAGASFGSRLSAKSGDEQLHMGKSLIETIKASGVDPASDAGGTTASSPSKVYQWMKNMGGASALTEYP